MYALMGLTCFWTPRPITIPSESVRMYCVEVEARPTFGKRPAVAEAEGTGDAESDALTNWQGVFPSDMHL